MEKGVGAISREMRRSNIGANTAQRKTTRVKQQSLVILLSDLNETVSPGRKSGGWVAFWLKKIFFLITLTSWNNKAFVETSADHTRECALGFFFSL